MNVTGSSVDTYETQSVLAELQLSRPPEHMTASEVNSVVAWLLELSSRVTMDRTGTRFFLWNPHKAR